MLATKYRSKIRGAISAWFKLKKKRKTISRQPLINPRWEGAVHFHINQKF